MKKLFLLTLLFAAFSMNAQDSKFYLGVGLGYATAGGDYDDYSGGIDFDFFDIGYRFNESWGVTLGLNSSGHKFDESGVEATAGFATFAIGPMYSFPVGNMQWDFKPQYAFSMAGVIDIDGIGEVDLKGDAFIIGNSLLIGDGKWQWSADLDYVMGNFDDIEGESFDADFNSLRIGVGVRYNF